MKKIFIDGRAGTTGLRIYERLENREDVELIILSEEDRKDPDKRRVALNSCDVAFLCLPDAAAREAVSMIENDNVVVIDTSTAHRTLEGWAYGFPELSVAHEEKIKSAKNAVKRSMLSGAGLKCEVIDGSFRNARQRATVNEPSITI